MVAYYNEIDPYAAQWLTNLIAAGHIAFGVVDQRSIEDVKPADLKGYTQCHFFAGIGGWSRALQLAGWPDDRPVWTGSCPCQPFSTAGKQKGKADERHLWPHWFRLIRECKPSTIFGEQVAAAIAHGWLDDAFNDLESEGYACGAAVLPACSVGAPHKRDRLWFVGDTQHNGSSYRSLDRGDGAAIRNNAQGENSPLKLERTIQSCDVANAEGVRRGEIYAHTAGGSGRNRSREGTRRGDFGSRDVADTSDTGLQRHWRHEQQYDVEGWQEPSGYHWARGVYIDCPDGKQRLIEPSIPLLANGATNRVGRLRAYGNAIVPQVAAEIIKTFMDYKP